METCEGWDIQERYRELLIVELMRAQVFTCQSKTIGLLPLPLLLLISEK